MNNLLSKSLKTAGGWRDCHEGKLINWLTLKDLAERVLEDVLRIKSHALVSADIPVYGFVYEVAFGRKLKVSAATEAGRAIR